MKGKFAALAAVLATVSLLVAMPCAVSAEVEWNVTTDVDLKAEPIDVASSDDGQLLYILVPGEVLVYSRGENRITERIPVDAGFDSLQYSDRDSALIVTSRTGKRLKVIQVEHVKSFDISGLPFRGPSDAPVTVVVFSDYQ